MLRYEYKYFVPNEHLNTLRSLIAPYVKLDEFAASCKQKRYTVRSIYFETPDFECYHTKLAGIKNRNKVRLRGYNEVDKSSVVFFEVKNKLEDPILKNRAPLAFQDVQQILQGANPDDYVIEMPPFEDAKISARKFLYHLYSRRMFPVVKVIYEREPWLDVEPENGNNLRVTLDFNLRAGAYPSLNKLADETDVRYALEGYFILEIKFNHTFPVWMSPIIAMLNLTRQSASKYCICIDRLHPEIDVRNIFDTIANGQFFE